MRTPAVLIAVVTALVLGACGASEPQSDEEQVRAAVATYAAAVGGDDPGRVCDVLITRSQIARAKEAREKARERCRERVEGGRLSAGQALTPVKVEAVRVTGGRAVARSAAGERIALRRVDGRWRIVAPG